MISHGHVSVFESALTRVFRKAGWRVLQLRTVQADFIVDTGKSKYAVAIKEAPEGRRDRLVPLLSQAILHAQTYARRFQTPATPLAIVAAKRIPPSVAEHLKQFAEENAPGVPIGIIDLNGLRVFVGPGLERFNAEPSRNTAPPVAGPPHLPDQFSDLNQWMLKILLGQYLSDRLISVPRGPIRNASQLAGAAKVSVMSASRFANQLASKGFLDKSRGELRIVRVEELLELWISANRQAAKELPARWIIKKGPDQWQSALREYARFKGGSRCCLGLFGAADALGMGAVRGVPPHIYLEGLNLDSLKRLGITVDRSNRAADLYIRIPRNREALFRASVKVADVPVSDVLQVYLDVSNHPARGREQASEIRRLALKPLFERQK